MCSRSIRTLSLSDILDLVLEEVVCELERTSPRKHQFNVILHRDEELLEHLRDYSSRMPIASVGTGRVLLDPVSMIAIETLSKVKGGTLVPPKTAGAGWVKSCLISEVTTRALDWEL